MSNIVTKYRRRNPVQSTASAGSTDVEYAMWKFLIWAGMALFGVSIGGTNAQESAKNGAATYRLCATCHSLQPGVSLSGPSLSKVWGKKAATTDGYGRYTEALKKSGIVWDENTLNAWLADPQAMVPGTTMTFRGVPQNETRANLIEFLRLALAPDGTARVLKDG